MDDGAEPVDQSPIVELSTAPTIHWAPVDPTTRPPRVAILAASPLGFRLGCHNRIDELIYEFTQVALWMTYSAPTD